jgi:hypothetical protein
MGPFQWDPRNCDLPWRHSHPHAIRFSCVAKLNDTSLSFVGVEDRMGRDTEGRFLKVVLNQQINWTPISSPFMKSTGFSTA